MVLLVKKIRILIHIKSKTYPLKWQRSAGSWALAFQIEERTSCFYFCCEIDEPSQETVELLGLLEIIPTYFGEAKIRPNPLKIVNKAKPLNINFEYDPSNVTGYFRTFVILHSMKKILEMTKAGSSES